MKKQPYAGTDGSYNEDYCKWCYAEGDSAYKSKESLPDFLVEHMPDSEHLTDEERRRQFDSCLSQLQHWK